jgi:aerobic-type carbon monoxide dehydrogenase small subunit (CoxS/CutS family)
MPDELAIRLVVNGTEQESCVNPRLLLSDYIRENLGLTGTHVGCAIGTCGSCTILVDGLAVRSCLMLAVQADGCVVRTIESIGSANSLSPVQQAFHEHHALQCGFCTPGLIVSVTGLLEANPDSTEAEILAVLGGHLCRCTGYRSILAAAQAAAAAMRPTR